MAANHPKADGEKLISANPKARHDFLIDEVVEAGMVLTGTEVKSMRNQAPNLRDAYVEVRQSGRKLEAWLLNTHVAPYTHGNIWNHDPLRKRKLLLHFHQLEQLFEAITQNGKSIVPLRMYFKKGVVKLELAVARGKKKHDKRDTQKERSATREMDQARKRERSD